jgi:DNA-binding CsgD family transcriptional regulator
MANVRLAFSTLTRRTTSHDPPARRTRLAERLGRLTLPAPTMLAMLEEVDDDDQVRADGAGDGYLLAQLTRRELEILGRTARGETNAEIAESLQVTVHAVKFHLGSVFRKLGVHNRTKAAAIYFASPGKPAPEEGAWT